MESVGQFGRRRAFLVMADQDCAFNSLCQILDRLEFIVAEVLPGDTDQQGVDGAYEVAYFFAYGHEIRIPSFTRDLHWGEP